MGALGQRRIAGGTRHPLVCPDIVAAAFPLASTAGSRPPSGRMPAAMHATDFLRAAKKNSEAARGLAVLYGEEAALKQDVVRTLHERLAGGDAMALTVVAGKETDWARVGDELHTVSMFGDHRIVHVHAADEFVSKYRGHLETYAEHPATGGTLVLDVVKWPKNTRLAKRVAKEGPGVAIECAPLKGAKLTKYLTRLAGEADKSLSGPAASLLTTLAGSSLTRLRQELDKLITYVGDRGEITPDDVQRLVGGWTTETTFAMLDAIRDGKLDEALEQLHSLLEAGEAPQRILGGVNWLYGSLCRAVERTRMGTPLGVALKESGVRPYAIKATEAYLRRVGRPAAERFRAAIQEVDLGLKGNSRLPDRIQMERLVIRLAGVETAV